MADNLIPEPNIQATNIPAGGGAQVKFNYVAPDNAFANLSQTFANASQTFLNFKDLEKREEESKKAWQSQLGEIEGLVGTGEVSEEQFKEIQRDANYKAQQGGIIGGHENWSIMDDVATERAKLYHDKKTSFFKEYMPQLTNPDADFGMTYDEVEELFNKRYAFNKDGQSEPIATDSQGNPIYSGTEGMKPLQLVAHSRFRTAHQYSITEAIDAEKSKNSIEGALIRGQSNIAEEYKNLVNRGKAPSSKAYTMPTVAEGGGQFSSFDEQLKSADRKGEIIVSKNVKEAERKAKTRSSLLGFHLENWQRKNPNKSAVVHPTTGKAVYYDKDGNAYTEKSETYLSPETEHFLHIARKEMDKMKKSGVENINEVMMTVIDGIITGIAEEAPLGDAEASKKINDLIYLFQNHFSHMEQDGKGGEKISIMFAPEGTAPHKKLDVMRNSALTLLSNNQKSLSADVEPALTNLKMEYMYEIRNGQPEESKKDLTRSQWVATVKGKYLDEAGDIVGFGDPEGFVRDLDTLSENLMLDEESAVGSRYFAELQNNLRANLILGVDESSVEAAVDNWVRNNLIWDSTGLDGDDPRGNELTQEQWDKLKQQAKEVAETNRKALENLSPEEKQILSTIQAQATSRSNVESMNAQISKGIAAVQHHGQQYYGTDAEDLIKYQLPNNGALVSLKSNELYKGLMGGETVTLDLSELQYMKKEHFDDTFQDYIHDTYGISHQDLDNLFLELQKMTTEGVKFDGDFRTRNTKYTNALETLEKYIAMEALYNSNSNKANDGSYQRLSKTATRANENGDGGDTTGTGTDATAQELQQQTTSADGEPLPEENLPENIKKELLEARKKENEPFNYQPLTDREEFLLDRYGK